VDSSNRAMFAISARASRHRMDAIPRSQQGFTLIELLLALSIFTFISSAVFVAMRSAVDSYSTFTRVGKRESELQSTVAILSQDLLQILPRVARGVAGDFKPAFMLKQGDYLLEFSRGGLPLESTASGLQRIAYQYRDGSLARYTWSYMDLLPVTNQVEAVLIDNIKSFEVKVFDAELNEHDSWPPNAVDDEGRNLLLMPNAVQILIDAGNEGKIERFIPGVSNVFLGVEDQERQQNQTIGGGDKKK